MPAQRQLVGRPRSSPRRTRQGLRELKANAGPRAGATRPGVAPHIDFILEGHVTRRRRSAATRIEATPPTRRGGRDSAAAPGREEPRSRGDTHARGKKEEVLQ